MVVGYLCPCGYSLMLSDVCETLTHKAKLVIIQRQTKAETHYTITTVYISFKNITFVKMCFIPVIK